jgi:hypothetical protein
LGKPEKVESGEVPVVEGLLTVWLCKTAPDAVLTVRISEIPVGPAAVPLVKFVETPRTPVPVFEPLLPPPPPPPQPKLESKNVAKEAETKKRQRRAVDIRAREGTL